ncbi:hypothetical protein [Caldilinea sp.]|uniref:hypothetical protein n=1 Tax=Caldilinea sp. TaxID=2293560 RepID=UPI002C56D317|nr:hypothetical protein [Caldilinea sp.]HRA64860.1 hypothetical protein [Caldilinea sp.]
MSRRRRGFEPIRFVRTTEGQLVIGFFVILYVVGGALIWYYYGLGGAIAGWLCITGGLFFFLLLYSLVSLAGWWANR